MTSAERGFWCVVPAAGRGRRFGGDRPKQHVEIAGKSLLGWTLERLASHPSIVGIVVVVAHDDASAGVETVFNGKRLLNVTGGEERADSVLAGLHGLPDSVADSDFVLVHDAARPCVRHADISALIERGMAAGGALLASPLRDTLKRADASGHVIETEPRESRWRALTPQMFRRAELMAALESARDDGVIVSDEAMAMERAGFKPLLVEGSDDNIKLTTPADRAFLEYLLKRKWGVGSGE
ncbi:MAG TPA: 2-C-methyl-D-erythritol 4-phosphate cytidylyltransferase [Dokdonella sp.]|uniref:2-C-methyl-D-erythritol 4-phosphate cytidylyltransferase n=1 Tax=Dokdonella sp. TaxID=2291710 RepID=UPI002D7FA076|nr:2-C-methyl-D-erythritol 4-phosphate cytidylyltransferase [Dokdonella sp.]HET9032978.1 2-C-methyl-D-erythritol 4-phosphate cytidylyltransferase [Dokdonella sp.]